MLEGIAFAHGFRSELVFWSEYSAKGAGRGIRQEMSSAFAC